MTTIIIKGYPTNIQFITRAKFSKTGPLSSRTKVLRRYLKTHYGMVLGNHCVTDYVVEAFIPRNGKEEWIIGS